MFRSTSNDSQLGNARRRVAWLDYAKGLGIILVVVGHANQAIGRTPGFVWSDGLRALDAVIYSFHMPMFFMLAGYAAGLGRGQDIHRFTRGTFWGVLLPYLVWSLLWISLKASMPGVTNHVIGWDAIARIPIEPIEHMWFLYHLLLIRVFWFAADRIASAAVHCAVLAIALVAAIALRQAPDANAIIAFFLENLAMYGIGMRLLPRLLELISDVDASPDLVALLTAAWVVVAVVPVILEVPISVLPAAMLGSAMVIGASRMLPDPTTLPLRALAACGEASLAIYLMHLIFMAGARAALAAAGVLDEQTLLASGIFAGLMLPLAAYRAIAFADRASGQSIARWVGMGSVPAARNPRIARA